MADKIKILCVEDEIDIRENLVGILESENFEVVEAENGKRGLEVFLEQHPDIVISDIMMPEVDGYELLKSIRENKNIDNNNVPFILLSALGQKHDILKGISLEANDYMVKPVDFDMLIAKIREKTASLKRTKEATKKSVTNLKKQFSHITPQEMLQYVNSINNISAALKSEIYGPLPHQRYLDDLNKIYISSLKLKTIVSNFLSNEAISNQIDISDEIINPVRIVSDFIADLNKKFQSKITIDTGSDFSLPDIKINKKILVEVLRKVVGCLFKINETMQIKLTFSVSHTGELIMIFYPDVIVGDEILQSYISKTISNSLLDGQGLSLEIRGNNIILSIPEYRVIKK
ncbi:MAG: response regulator receiver sensor signal transduction histidine kinase [Rickettsiaceae bacterium]|jgi:CheY-like chemotaxis protein|nr:response regulator receiver sensor signal transduction histidine kinase [Rickettsiaceae bacterium]